MRKVYTTTDGKHIAKNGRPKKIRYTMEDCYFLWNGRRQKCSEIPGLTFPIMYEDDNGKTGFISGYIVLFNFGGVLVEINDDYTHIQLWDELD